MARKKVLADQIFGQCFTLLCERWGKQFSRLSLQEWRQALVDAGIDDEDMMRASRKIFREAEFFPSPQELIDVARATRPSEPYVSPARSLPGADIRPDLLPGAEPKKPDPELLASIAAAREIVSKSLANRPKSRVFASVGESLGTAVKFPGQPDLSDETLAKLNNWLRGGDRIMRREAIAIAMNREDLNLRFDDTGEPVEIVRLPIVERSEGVA